MQQLVSSFTNWYAHRRTIVDIAIASIGMFLFPVDLWLYTLVFYCFVYMPLQSTTFHDFLSHEQVRPKNKVIELFVLCFFVVYSWTSLRYKKNYHFLHHKYTEKEKDPTNIKITGMSWWKFLFDLGPTQQLNLDEEERPMLISPLWLAIDKYFALIAFVGVVAWLTFLPLWTWFAFYIYPKVLGDLTARIIDIQFHKIHTKDTPALVFIYGSGAWHYSHHKSWRFVYYGSKPWCYMNMQLWITKLLFRPK